MALKRWYISEFSPKNLVDGASDWWTVSSGGTNEYYYNQGLFQHTPNLVTISGVDTSISSNDAGSLYPGEWAWGDNDSIGEDTIYVRLSTGVDPDTTTSGCVQCSEPVELLEATADKETILLSLLISNYSTDDDANIWVFHTDGSNILFRWFVDILVDNSPFALDSKLVFEPGDKLLFMSAIDDVSVICSGDES